MSFKKTLLCACMITGMAFTTAPGFADDEIIVTTRPPAPRVETVPEPRSGYVWDEGYWGWYRGEHVWTPGHWIEIPHTWEHAEWVHDHWEQQDETHWRFVAGHWKTE